METCCAQFIFTVAVRNKDSKENPLIERENPKKFCPSYFVLIPEKALTKTSEEYCKSTL